MSSLSDTAFLHVSDNFLIGPVQRFVFEGFQIGFRNLYR